jgi:AraC family transcriptional regulator, ethanolamine operon transcriptional activator
MPAQTQTFYSYEPYADAIQGASLRAVFLGRKFGNWALSHLSVNNLGVQWGHTGGPGAVEGTVQPGGCTIIMPTLNAYAISGNGRRFDDRSLMVLRPGGEFCLSATNLNRWFTVFVPDDLLTGFNGIAPADIGPLCDLIRVPSDGAERFRSAFETLGLIVQRQPGAFDSSAAIQTTTRKLREAVRQVLKGEPDVTCPHGRQAFPRREIIRRTMDFVDQHADEYLVVEDLASAADVSERTLRTAFQQYFSIGPVRYLRLRTLHQVRRALKTADPSNTTVTEIATQFGVWELGRFAQDYNFLFGELPSRTLRRLH